MKNAVLCLKISAEKKWPINLTGSGAGLLIHVCGGVLGIKPRASEEHSTTEIHPATL